MSGIKLSTSAGGSLTLSPDDTLTTDETLYVSNIPTIITDKYYTTDGLDADLDGSTILGDATLTLAEVVLLMTRINDHVTLSGRMTIEGFSANYPSDSAMLIDFDIERIAVAEEWFTNVLDAKGVSTLIFSGDGFDKPEVPAIVDASTKGFKISSGETPYTQATDTCTKCVAYFNMTLEVE